LSHTSASFGLNKKAALQSPAQKLPPVVTYRETLEEAQRNARKAIEL